jgi:hypothetical protein
MNLGSGLLLGDAERAEKKAVAQKLKKQARKTKN